MNDLKKSISESVRESIDARPYLRHSLAEGLLNYSALARQVASEIEENTGKKVNEESLIVAIKRYADSMDKRIAPEAALEVIGNASLSMQEEISYALFNRSDRVREAVEELFREEEWELGEIKMVLDGANKTFVILKTKRLQKLLESTENELIETKNGKSLVSLEVPNEAYTTYGVLHEITEALAKAGISIEVVVIPPSLHFVVATDDVEKAYRILKDLIKRCRSTVGKNNKSN